MSKLSGEPVVDQEPSTSTPAKAFLRRFGRDPLALAAALFLLVVLGAAALAPAIAPYDPNRQDLRAQFEPPSAEHWLGTDDLGRDLLSRLMFGARVSMQVGLTVVFVSMAIAIPIGLWAGFRGGRIDTVLMRIMDGALAFPPIVLALAVAGVMGPGVRNVIIALIVVFVPGTVRLVRGQALAVAAEPFIEASRSIGTKTSWILRRRVLPNVRAPLIVSAATGVGFALLAEAGLSFIGLGPKVPDPSWGNMLRRAYDRALFTDPWQLVIPGAAIALTILAANTLGDGLRAALGAEEIQARRRLREGRLGITAVKRPSSLQSCESEESLLAVQGLSIEFDTPRGVARVINDLTFDVHKGEILGVVGESGSGKTVTSLAIMRLLPSPPATVVAGQICFEGEDLLAASFSRMREIRGSEIAMIFQDPMTSLNPAFTIGRQLVEVQRLHEINEGAAARRRARELLDLVGIPAAQQRLREYPHQLSGGMRQRVMIAMALACEPHLLIADEPTTALDVTIEAQILDLLRQLQTELEMAVIFVTHDLGTVADLCDRVLVIYAGQVVEEADVDDLFATPSHPYTEGLLAASPHAGADLDGRLSVIPGQVPDIFALPVGCTFHPRCPYAVDECRTAPVELRIAGRRSTRCIREVQESGD